MSKIIRNLEFVNSSKPKPLQRAAADFFFSFFPAGSGANRLGGAGASAGWESEAHRAFNGTGFQEGDPQKQMGPGF